MAFPFIIVALSAAALIQPATKPAPPAPATTKAPAAAASGPYHVIKTLQVGGEGAWDYVSIDPDTGRLYVPRSTRVIVLDTQSGNQVGEIADTAGVHGVALAAALGKGFTSNGKSDNVTVFDLKTLKVIQTVNAGKNPDAILYEPVTKRVFAFNGRSNDATVIGAEDLTVAGTIPLGGKPEFAVADGEGKVFVNVEDTSELVRIDAKTMKVEERFSLAPGSEPSGLAIDPAHHRLFSVCHNEMMVVVDAQSGKVLGTPAIGKGVDGAGFDAGGGFALSSNGEGTITVVSTTGDHTFTPVQTLTTAPGARTMVVDPKTRHIYLPTAEFLPPPPTPEGEQAGARRRPAMKPGSFRIVVVGP
jgi:YVTN family beta-propeller protein